MMFNYRQEYHREKEDALAMLVVFYWLRGKSFRIIGTSQQAQKIEERAKRIMERYLGES